MTVKEVIRMLKKEGWFELRQSGSHRQFRHKTRAGLITVPIHNDDLSKGTLISILKKAGIK